MIEHVTVYELMEYIRIGITKMIEEIKSFEAHKIIGNCLDANYRET